MVIFFKHNYVRHHLDFFTGETPLIHAARQGHADTARYLIECGANPAIASDLGATALHHSAGIGKFTFFIFFFFSSGAPAGSRC